MTIVLTGDVAFKTKLLNVLTANELGGASAYEVSFAGQNSFDARFCRSDRYK